MGINIKSDRVHQLARDAAAVLGTTQVGAIELALERLLADEGHDVEQARIAARIDLVTSILVDYDVAAAPANSEITHVQDLYEPATGMPR
jgi:antitoxin VapB